NGNYFMLIPSYSEVIYDSEIPFSRKSKIKKYLKGINTKGYGVLVKASTLKGTEEEWSADLTKLLIDKKSTVSEDEKLTHTGDYLKRKSGIFFNAGLTYLLASKINNTFSTELDRLNVASNQLLFTDTLVNADTKKTTLPSELTVGFSLDKPTANGKKKNGTNRTATWSLGTEVSFLNGSNYVNPSPTRADDLVNGFRLGMGGEWVPNLNAKLKKEYFKRVFYRLGASYRKMPYLDNGQAVNDFGIQFGMGLPVGRYNLVTTFPKYVNLSFELGRRGDVSKGQIKENYFFTTLGFTINDKWFKRSKLGL
ncbi:MAG: hypothetical protein AB8B61_10300, partial [Cyclobacteriaceae bacterium]